MGKVHWYNNGKVESLIDSDSPVPDGFVRGRLPFSEETLTKLRKHLASIKLTPEQEMIKRQRCAITRQNKTDEEKRITSERISKNRTGKGVGKPSWNKGLKGVQKAWNKGLHYSLKESSRVEMLAKRYNTQKERGTLCVNQDTEVERNFHQYLLTMYDEQDILHPYMDKERYPFKCDFYIKSKDVFIEIHGNWTHGGMPYDENNEECQKKLALWQEKAKTSDYYKNAIYVWTDLDVRKVKTAKDNGVNLLVLYSKRGVIDFSATTIENARLQEICFRGSE